MVGGPLAAMSPGGMAVSPGDMAVSPGDMVVGFFKQSHIEHQKVD